MSEKVAQDRTSRIVIRTFPEVHQKFEQYALLQSRIVGTKLTMGQVFEIMLNDSFERLKEENHG